MYGAGLPVWHCSLALQNLASNKPVLAVRWTASTYHRMLRIRDHVFAALGQSAGAFVEERTRNAIHFRLPLRVDEIAQLAPTAEVRARPGRP